MVSAALWIRFLLLLAEGDVAEELGAVFACRDEQHAGAVALYIIIRWGLGGGVGSRAQEVAVVGEEERRHDGVEVDDEQELSCFAVEHHVVHLRIAVADAARQLALAEEALTLTHALGIALEEVERLSGDAFSVFAPSPYLSLPLHTNLFFNI